MKPRKRTDSYPAAFTLKRNGVAFDLSGYTVTMTAVDKATRATLIADAPVTIVEATAGRISFDSAALGAAPVGSYDLEAKAVNGSLTYHWPSQDYEPMQIQQSLG